MRGRHRPELDRRRQTRGGIPYSARCACVVAYDGGTHIGIGVDRDRWGIEQNRPAGRSGLGQRMSRFGAKMVASFERDLRCRKWSSISTPLRVASSAMCCSSRFSTIRLATRC